MYLTILCNSLYNDDDFMKFAEIAASKSNDDRTKVGACIVKDGKIVGLG